MHLKGYHLKANRLFDYFTNRRQPSWLRIRAVKLRSREPPRCVTISTALIPTTKDWSSRFLFDARDCVFPKLGIFRADL